MPTKKVTTKPRKRGRPLGSKNKFKSNPFAKKYKESLDDFRKDYSYGADSADEDTVDSTVYAWKNAEQVKSWSRHEQAGIYDQIARSIVMFLLGVIIGIVVINL